MKEKLEKVDKAEEIIYVNRNTFKILSDANKVMRANWGEIVSSSLLYVCSIVLLWFFPVFGFVLSFFATGFLSLGYIGFIISVSQNKTTKLEFVFSYLKNCLSAFALRLTMVAFVFLWGLLLIVPGVIVSLNYSFAMSIMSQNPNIGTFSALEKSKEMVKGYRDIIFSLYLLLFFFSALVYGLAVVVPLMICLFVVSFPLWINFAIAGVVLLVVFSTILMPYFQVAITSVYLEAKKNKRYGKIKEKE